jgi:hypothetical protein
MQAAYRQLKIASVLAAATVVVVHYIQSDEKNVRTVIFVARAPCCFQFSRTHPFQTMRQGVARDIERQKVKREVQHLEPRQPGLLVSRDRATPTASPGSGGAASAP